MRSFEPARRAEIARILGENWDADLRYLSEADRAILSFLPVEKRIAAWKAANHIPWGKAVAKPAAALSRVLSPEELNEITLRTSDTATDLRQNLIGFEPTEEEFHTIVRLREVGSSAKSPEDAARAESDLKTALGEARYAEFLRARDPVFKAAYIFARHYGMPITSAAQAYSAAKASEAGAARIRSDANLSPEEKQTAIAGNSKLLESTLSATLGKPCSDALRWFAHSWFEALDSVTASGDGLK